jgi:hypothetical protein
MMALSLFLGFGILMNGSTFAAFQGRFAQKLDLPGSGVIPYIPWTALAGYVAAVFALRAVKRTRTRWLGFIIVTVIANTVIAYPIILLDHGFTRIPVKDLISRESQASFEARYPVKIVSYSASYEGACIRVRKDQYSAEMASYITDLIRRQD